MTPEEAIQQIVEITGTFEDVKLFKIIRAVAATAEHDTLVEVVDVLMGKAKDAFVEASEHKDTNIGVSVRFHAMGRALEAAAECFETMAEEKL